MHYHEIQLLHQIAKSFEKLSCSTCCVNKVFWCFSRILAATLVFCCVSWEGSPGPNQSHYIEVRKEAIFMEHNMRFRLILGQVAILKKKIEPIMCNFWSRFFKVFMGNFFFFKHCSVHTKKLHNISYIFYSFLAKNRLNIHNQLCIAPQETPFCATSI